MEALVAAAQRPPGGGEPEHQIAEPASVSAVYGASGLPSTPEGIEMNERTSGLSRPRTRPSCPALEPRLGAREVRHIGVEAAAVALEQRAGAAAAADLQPCRSPVIRHPLWQRPPEANLNRSGCGQVAQPTLRS